MKTPDHSPPTGAPPQPRRGAYIPHRLATLDGVLIHVTCDGETVGFYFGATEAAAAAAVARDVAQVIPDEESRS